MSKSIYHEWKVGKKKSRSSYQVLKLKAEKREENLPDTIQGKSVGSTEEARLAVALGFLQIPFEYQYWVFGGSAFRGGQIIDFLVFTAPLPTPVYVQSRYWHGPEIRKGNEDLLKMAQVRKHMKGWADPIEIWDYELTSVEAAIQVAHRHFGRGR